MAVQAIPLLTSEGQRRLQGGYLLRQPLQLKPSQPVVVCPSLCQKSLAVLKRGIFSRGPQAQEDSNRATFLRNPQAAGEPILLLQGTCLLVSASRDQ